jgi:hypothetical protein
MSGRLLPYALQTGPLNLRLTDLESITRERVLTDPSAVDETPLDEYRWQAEDFDDEELEEQDDEDDDEDENEDNDDEDEDEEEDDGDEEEEPPLYVEDALR